MLANDFVKPEDQKELARFGWREIALLRMVCLAVSYLLCLTASKSRMAALTDTLSESSCPFMGMRMCASAASRHVSVSPVASVPMTIAVAWVMSVS